jgi:hypothetical protein
VPAAIELGGLREREQVADDARGASDVVADLFEFQRAVRIGRIGGQDFGAAQHALERALEVLREAGHHLSNVDEPVGGFELRLQNLGFLHQGAFALSREDLAHDKQCGQAESEGNQDGIQKARGSARNYTEGRASDAN